MRQQHHLLSHALGPEIGCAKEVKSVNGIIRSGDRRIAYEPDPRRAEAIIKERGLDGAKSLSSAGVAAASEVLELKEYPAVSNFVGLPRG